MIGETKKILKKLVCAGIVILASVVPAKATLVDANAVEEGLEYYIRIDKGVYDLGETIEMLGRITNVGDETLNVAELGCFSLRFKLARLGGDILKAPLIIVPCIPDIVTLNPGEYMERRYNITSLTWGLDGQVVDEPFTIFGQYSIISEYDNNWPGAEGPLTLEPDALDFVIIPEPASIFLFSLGLTSLLVRKKGKSKCSK